MEDGTDATHCELLIAYVRKVGRTSDDMYKPCFAAYTSSKHFKVRACRDLVCKVHECGSVRGMFSVVSLLFCRTTTGRAVVDWWSGVNVSAFVIFPSVLCPRFLMEYDLFNQELTDFFVQKSFVCEGTWLVIVRWWQCPPFAHKRISLLGDAHHSSAISTRYVFMCCCHYTVPMCSISQARACSGQSVSRRMPPKSISNLQFDTPCGVSDMSMNWSCFR